MNTRHKPISTTLPPTQRQIILAPDLYATLVKRADRAGIGLQPLVHLLLQRALIDDET